MIKKKVAQPASSELETAKMEAMRIRFRRVLGETVPPHMIKKVRKDIAKCVKELSNADMRGKDA